MPLKMKMQERKRFVERARWEYAHVKSRKAKSALIDSVVQFVGYQSRKQAIRALNRKEKSKEGRIRSINTDNGSEFINYHFQDFLKEHYRTCTITRSRPNKKNDNARVEERNLHVVRECIGYERLGDERFVRALNRIYRANNLLINHFQTWSRVASKERHGTHVIRRMDTPQTPYQRVMKHIKDGRRKRRLQAIHESLNPWELRAEIQAAMTVMSHLFEEIQFGCSGGRRCNRKETC